MISASDVVGHPSGTDAGVRVVRESGLNVTGLEALRDFEGLDGRMHAYKVDVAKSMLEVCGRLGGRLLLVEATTSTHADADPERIVRDLRMLATLAIPMGIRIAYKGMAWSRTTKDFAAAGDLVFRANCPNLGVAIDAFDVIRPSASRGSRTFRSWSSTPGPAATPACTIRSRHLTTRTCTCSTRTRAACGPRPTTSC